MDTLANSSASEKTQDTRKAGKKAKTEEAVQRNREIQAKYRQRVRAHKEHLLAQHEAACVELQRERQQVVELATENAVLEGVAALKADWIAALQEAGEPCSSSMQAASTSSSRLQSLIGPYPYNRARADTLQTASSSGLSSAGSTDLEVALSSQQGGEQQAAAAAAAPLPVRVAAGGASWPRAGTGSLAPSNPLTVVAGTIGSLLAAAGESVREAQADASAHNHFDPIANLEGLPLGPDVIRCVKLTTPEQLASNWLEYVSKTRDMLAQFDLTPSESLRAEIKLLMEQWGLLVAVMLVHNPGSLQQLMASQLGSQMSEEEEKEKWDSVLAALELTQAQRQQYIKWLEDYNRQLVLIREHKNIAQQLIQQGTNDPEQLRQLGTNPRMTYLGTWEALQVLHACPDLAFIATLELMGNVCLDWTPMQKARLVVGGGPNFPDIVSLLHAIIRAESAAVATPGPSNT